MIYQTATYSAPVTRLGRWLVEPGADVPGEIRPMLLAGLFGTLVIFFGGVFNTMAVSEVASWRHPHPVFLGWAAYELILGGVRLYVLWHARRNALVGRKTYTDAYVILALMWALGVGYGSLVGLLSRDWLIGGITTISAAAMAGGIAFRNFYAPRLCTAMVILSFGRPRSVPRSRAGGSCGFSSRRCRSICSACGLRSGGSTACWCAPSPPSARMIAAPATTS